MGNTSGSTTKKQVVRVKSQTYTKDSYGLFDFQSSEYKTEVFDLTEDAYLIRKEFKIMPMKKMPKRNDTYDLMNINFSKETPSAEKLKTQLDGLEGYNEEEMRKEYNFHEKFIWRVIDNNEAGVRLMPGTIFRMGRLRFRVREFFDGVKSNDIGIRPNRGVENIYKPKPGDDNGGLDENGDPMRCRICLEEQTPGNDFANVCSCTRSMPLHANCLMDWIKSKMNSRKTNYFIFYSWKFLDCDICRKPFPEYFYANDRQYDLLSYEKPENSPFLAIDLFHKDKNTIRGCFVIKKTKTILRVGRGHDCEIRLSDISISRNHANLIFNKNGFYINDLKSKFGTLVLMQKSAELVNSINPVKFQIGRTLIELKPLAPKKSSCLCGSASDGNVKKNPFIELEDQKDFTPSNIQIKEEKSDNGNVATVLQNNNNNVQQNGLNDQAQGGGERPRRANFPTNNPNGNILGQDEPLRNLATRAPPANSNPDQRNNQGQQGNANGLGDAPLNPDGVGIEVNPNEEDSLMDLFSDSEENEGNNQNRSDDHEFESSEDQD